METLFGHNSTGARSNGCPANKPARQNKSEELEKEVVQAVEEHNGLGLSPLPAYDCTHAHYQKMSHCAKVCCSKATQLGPGQTQQQPMLFKWTHNKTSRRHN